MAKLKRDLNLFFAVMAGVGIILGAGIYVLIGEAAGIAGNGVWLAFLVSALLAGITGLSYAELSSMFTRDDGEYQYGKIAFGKYVAFLVAFMIIFEGIISAAAVALGFGGYLGSLLFGDATMAMIISLSALCVVVFSYISYYGIKQSAIANLIFTFIEAAGLIFIIAIGVNKWGSVDYLQLANGIPSVFEAAALIFFAFVGFEAIIKLSEETKNPTKTIPKALLWSIVITTIIYILVAISAVSVIPWQELAASSAPLATVAAAAFGSKAFIALSIIALFSTGNTVLILLLTTSRMMYGLGREIPSLHFLRHVDAKRKTPWLAVLITGVLCVGFVLIGKINLVASTSNFTIFMTFLIVNLSLIWIRHKMPNAKRPFKVPLSIKGWPILPILGALVSVVMFAFLDKLALVGGFVLFVLAGVLYYVFFHLVTGKKRCTICTKS